MLRRNEARSERAFFDSLVAGIEADRIFSVNGAIDPGDTDVPGAWGRTLLLEETQGQVERIDQVVEATGIRLKRMKCVAMEGLIEEGQELIDEIEKGPVLDAGLVAAAQKVEHYEIAAYGGLCAIGKQLGFSEAVTLLKETLEEEKATDLKLTQFAEKAANMKTTND
ncbi:ferritin-like domain-containing protein [Paraburkholderia sp. BR10923]|uniref:ferritin-like domain-containing protein n=1 Tax=Paraburkholderia sp. BR10923 TaxID=3236992 RepID=UPI0034CF52E4